MTILHHRQPPQLDAASNALLLTATWRRMAFSAPLLGLFLAFIVLFSSARALPASQFADLPEGVALELLAAVPASTEQSQESGTFLLRYTYAPGARLDLPYPGPLLVFVAEGTLTLEHVGNNVSITSPSLLNDQPLSAKEARKRRRGEPLPVGSYAELPEGGSAFAEMGELGPTSNEGSDELVLLVVQFVTDERKSNATRIAVPGTPSP